jgi:hypothetical protein
MGSLNTKIQRKTAMPETMMRVVKVVSEVGFHKFEQALEFISSKGILRSFS